SYQNPAVCPADAQPNGPPSSGFAILTYDSPTRSIVPLDSLRSPKPAREQSSDRRQAVGPADLLAGLLVPALVGDWHLEDPVASSQQLRGDLRLDVVSAAAQIERPRKIGRDHLVAGLHVGQRRAVQEV